MRSSHPLWRGSNALQAVPKGSFNNIYIQLALGMVFLTAENVLQAAPKAIGQIAGLVGNYSTSWEGGGLNWDRIGGDLL